LFITNAERKEGLPMCPSKGSRGKKRVVNYSRRGENSRQRGGSFFVFFKEKRRRLRVIDPEEKKEKKVVGRFLAFNGTKI